MRSWLEVCPPLPEIAAYVKSMKKMTGGEGEGQAGENRGERTS